MQIREGWVYLGEIRGGENDSGQFHSSRVDDMSKQQSQEKVFQKKKRKRKSISETKMQFPKRRWKKGQNMKGVRNSPVWNSGPVEQGCLGGAWISGIKTGGREEQGGNHAIV